MSMDKVKTTNIRNPKLKELGIPNSGGAKYQYICLYFKIKHYFGFAEGRLRLG